MDLLLAANSTLPRTLASSFTPARLHQINKAGKPPETKTTPAVKSYTALTSSKMFDPIKAAGTLGDAGKAKGAFEKAAPLFAKYLEDVGLPGDFSDPLYR